MLTTEELRQILTTIETDRIEKTISMTNVDKFGEAICAFSNDLPNHKQNGYLIIGVKNDNTLADLSITDDFLRMLSDFGTDGRILPMPVLFVNRYELDGKQLAVIEVVPAFHPPVRYKGKVHIRIGARKAAAGEAEERILIEKRTATARTFDALPCWEAEMRDLAIDIIKLSYLPLAIDNDTLIENHRDFKQQVASLRLYDLKHDKPTNAGILLFGLNPSYFLFGAYIQYVKTNDTTRNLDKVVGEKQFKGSLFDTLREIDNFIRYNIIASKPVRIENSFQDKIVHNYIYGVLRELVMNAIMHRDYESNAPIYIYEFSDRIEIRNAGGLYGEVNAGNFPNKNAYRNPILAETMKNLKYINRFNFGIPFIEKQLQDKGFLPAEFDISSYSSFAVTVMQNLPKLGQCGICFLLQHAT
jgi:ATP-dependent DNA helicase RecG